MNSSEQTMLHIQQERTHCKSAKADHIDYEHSDEKLFFIHTVKGLSNKPALTTCTINKCHKVTFEIDMGALCNILPFTDYVKATGNKQGTQIFPFKTQLTMHNNTSAVPLDKAMLRMERGGNTYLLRFFVMQSPVMSILGKISYNGMKLVHLDCDEIHSISSNTSNSPMAKCLIDPILQKYHDIFSGLGGSLESTQ